MSPASFRSKVSRGLWEVFKELHPHAKDGSLSHYQCFFHEIALYYKQKREIPEITIEKDGIWLKTDYKNHDYKWSYKSRITKNPDSYWLFFRVYQIAEGIFSRRK